uniref:Bromo domain-containing protein n=1 Tax=Strongyloides papillosus TaxID=174720 RepID=A0A0N5CFY8_STREA
MTSYQDKCKYTQFRRELENVFSGIKILLLDKLENPNDYWVSVDLKLTKKDMDDDYNFSQANENFNKMILEKEKRRKKYEKVNKDEYEKIRKVEKRKSRKKKEKIVTLDDSDSSREIIDKTTCSNDSSKSLVSTKCKKSKKKRSCKKKNMKSSKTKNIKEKSISKKNKKRDLHSIKKSRYFPNLDDDVFYDESMSKSIKEGKSPNNNGPTNQDTSEVTLDTIISTNHVNQRNVSPQYELSLSKIDPKLLSSKNRSLHFHRNKTLRFIREACCNSRIVLFKPQK